MNLSDPTPKATLLEQMAATPRYRLNGLPRDTRNVIICADASNAAAACKAVAEHCPEVNIEGLCLHKGEGTALAVQLRGATHEIPLIPAEELGRYPHCLLVLYWQGCIVPDLLYHLETAVRQSLSIVIFPRIPFGTGRKHDATFYAQNSKELDALYASLQDAESKISFASVVKGIITGEIDWLRPPVFPEYQHSSARAEAGDVIIDAGLFDSTILRRFALTAGPKGHVYGFEPEPKNFAFVQQTLQRFGDPGNITLVKKGLYSSCGSMHISDEGPSGTLLKNASAGAAPCEVTDLDSFARAMRLERLDLVKMDIEGAECAALHGAAESLRRWKPKLHICAYHRIADIIEIPRIIHDIVPEYRFSFMAHVPYLNEYIYYATVR